ncbi:MAG: DUF58 domain-containing protein [Janthinobacterium lividum]
MIYPTRAAILTAAAGVPVALVVAVLVPGRWYAALAWPLAVLALTLADALAGRRRAGVTLVLPPAASVGETVMAQASVTVAGGTPPRSVQIALDPDPLLSMEEDGRWWLALDGGRTQASLPIATRRRGTARIGRAWLRWRGPFGLAWQQRVVPLDVSLAILPDIRPVRQRGAALFQRYALQGLVAQVERGEGTDFDALVEYRSGMDRRAIDWKQSARHGALYAKEYRTERNNQIVFALDAGRQMAEPVAGLPRIDRAVSASLLTAWIALRLGDRVALTAFDSRPRIASGFVSGAGAFAELQRLAAGIDYSADEANYTFALTTLGQRLTRRSMIVLFAEVTDMIAAEFMVRAAARLAERHLLLVVVLRDEELEAIVDRAPETPDDVTRAVTAAGLLRDRLLVLTRLRHGGAHVIEAAHDQVGERLVEGYVDLKRRNLL